MRGWRVGCCLALLWTGVAWSQAVHRLGQGPWVTIAWTYSLEEPLAQIGFVLESCVATAEGCLMLGRWVVSPLTLSAAVPRPHPHETRCYQVRAIGPVARGDASNRLCLGAAIAVDQVR